MGNGSGQKGLHTVRQENDKFCQKYSLIKDKSLIREERIKESYLFSLDGIKKV